MPSICIFFFLVLCAACSATMEKTSNLRIYQKYMEMDKQLQRAAEKGAKQLLPFIMEANEHLNISANCTRNILALMRGITKLKLSALSFLDASGKPSDGILVGNLNHLGDYSQCLNITVRKKNGNIDFRGKYCLLRYSLVIPKHMSQLNNGSELKTIMDLTKKESELMHYVLELVQLMSMWSPYFGICVPSGCAEKDIEQVAKYVVEPFMVKVKVESCEVEGWYNFFDARNIVIICIFCFFGMLGILGSVVEYSVTRKDKQMKGTLTKVLICFSFSRNFQKLMNTKTESDSTLSCLHGIRVLTLFYIILCHQYYVIFPFSLVRQLKMFSSMMLRFSTQIVVNGFLSVDIFFFISGLVHSYTRMKRKHDPALLGYIKMIFFRIWRLAPSYIFAVLTMFLLQGHGPFSVKSKREFLENCEKNWWWNLLFINNFLKRENDCFFHSWYVSADLQIFLLSVVTVGLLIRYPSKGIVANCVLLLSGLVTTIAWCWTQNVPPNISTFRQDEKQVFKYMQAYTLPLSHIAPYFAGVFLGYFLVVKKDLKISKFCQVIGWPTAFVCFTSILFVPKKWNTGEEYTRLESALYYSFGRLVYTLGVAWIIFCCATGHGGIINFILSMKLWIPLSRMSYAIYLISPVVQIFNSVNKRYSYDIHEMNLIWQHFGDIVVSTLMGMFIVLLVESPSITLQNLLLKRERIAVPEIQKEGAENKGFKCEPIENNFLKSNVTSEVESLKNKKNAISPL